MIGEDEKLDKVGSLPKRKEKILLGECPREMPLDLRNHISLRKYVPAWSWSVAPRFRQESQGQSRQACERLEICSLTMRTFRAVLKLKLA